MMNLLLILSLSLNSMAGGTAFLLQNSMTQDMDAAGGTVSQSGTYKVHTFTTTGTSTFTVTTGGRADVVVVAGGGGSGGYTAGGGGAGGVVAKYGIILAAGTYTVTVGVGGTTGQNGGNSSFVGGSINLSATGGGYGGSGGGNYSYSATSGGSGGGGGSSSGNYTAGNGTTNQGYAGGASGTMTGAHQSGGGGGAGAAGGAGNSTSGFNLTPGGNGTGGNGVIIPFFNQYVAGGGSGGNSDAWSDTSIQGFGGGGKGGRSSAGNGSIVSACLNGRNGLGGGAGGDGGTGSACSGGSGVVMIRYTSKSISNSSALTCPSGYIKVPSMAGYSANDFCVMKYEAKNVSGVATSQASGTPWIGNTRDQARTLCSNLGSNYSLVTVGQWQAIAKNIASVASNWSSGTVLSGKLNQGVYNLGALQAADVDSNPCVGTGASCSQTTWHTNRRTHKLTNGEIIWDISGNSPEWNYENNYYDSTGLEQVTSKVSNRQETIVFGAQDICPIDSSYCGFGYHWGYNTTSNGILRGGGYNSAANHTGVFAAHRGYPTTDTSGSSSFRCVFQAAQAKTSVGNDVTLTTTTGINKHSFLSVSGGTQVSINNDDGHWHSIRATGGISVGSGKKYFEATITSKGAGVIYVGVGSAYGEGGAHLNSSNGHIFLSDGNDAAAFGYATSGAVRTNEATLFSGSSYTTGDVIGVVVDSTFRTVTFYKNGSSQGTYNLTGGSTYYPMISLDGDGTGAADSVVTLNFGASAFSYSGSY